MDIYREYENDSEYKDQRRGVVGMKFVKKILLVLVCALSLEGCGFTGNNVWHILRKRVWYVRRIWYSTRHWFMDGVGGRS